MQITYINVENIKIGDTIIDGDEARQVRGVELWEGFNHISGSGDYGRIATHVELVFDGGEFDGRGRTRAQIGDWLPVVEPAEA